MEFDFFSKVQEQVEKDKSERLDQKDDFILPKVIRNFLGELGMLEHIPIYYLIPDEQYLPQNKENGGGVLKFFRLDKEWIECLMDGALSLAAPSERELLLAKSMAGNYVAEVYYNDTRAQIIKQIKGAYNPIDFEEQLKNRLAEKHVSLEENRAIPTKAQNNWNYTGFVMRSPIISAWIGVEVIAKGDDPDTKDDKSVVIEKGKKNRPLQVIRLERLTNDTLFCICEGMITEVEIIQPPEAIHFDLSEKIDVFERNPNDLVKGVIDIKKLKGTSSSANFAKEKSSKPLKVVIKVNWNK